MTRTGCGSFWGSLGLALGSFENGSQTESLRRRGFLCLVEGSLTWSSGGFLVKFGGLG